MYFKLIRGRVAQWQNASLRMRKPWVHPVAMDLLEGIGHFCWPRSLRSSAADKHKDILTKLGYWQWGGGIGCPLIHTRSECAVM